MSVLLGLTGNNEVTLMLDAETSNLARPRVFRGPKNPSGLIAWINAFSSVQVRDRDRFGHDNSLKRHVRRAATEILVLASPAERTR